ncbi:MAG: hypothetical protein ACRDI3_03060 [Actinomycetota bacterium]
MAGLRTPRDDRYGRLEAGQPVNTVYRVVHDTDGSVRALYRIAWNGDDFAWVFGNGYFANVDTEWHWCPEDFSQQQGMAWNISGMGGMGGADDESEPIADEDALAILAEHGTAPDSIDRGEFPSDEERGEFQRRRELLKPP